MTEPALIMMLEYAKELYLVELFGIVVFSRTSMSKSRKAEAFVARLS